MTFLPCHGARHRSLAISALVFVLLAANTRLMAQPQRVRFATYNASLNQCFGGRGNPCLEGGLAEALADPSLLQGRQVAEIIQRLRPDVLLLNEFNYDAAGLAADRFQQNFLGVPQNVIRSLEPSEPIEYAYRYLAPSNTGIASGFDLNNDGQVGEEVGTQAYGDDAFGFGEFPGRYGMLLLSKYPIDEVNVRTFQNFLWRDMPGGLLPDDLRTAAAADWYSPEELEVLRLSSKSHWDVPIQIGDQRIHVLASHPTPPAFDGAEDRNGRRNHDEIRLWADYISPDAGDYLVDDAGVAGPLSSEASFVIMGDLNADPDKGDSFGDAIEQLLDHPRVNSSRIPTTANGGTDTATFNLRVDYVLPSTDLSLVDTAIFRPANTDPLARLVRASDHFLVWADIEVAAIPEPSAGLLGAWAAIVLGAWARRRRVA